jgi:hypothetical protein
MNTPAYPAEPFEDLKQARVCVHKFVQWRYKQASALLNKVRYACEHHQGEDGTIMQRRKPVH